LASGEPVPNITSVIPNHGPPAGGTKVTITGTSFTGASEVHFGSTEAKSFKVESETEITAVSPPFAGGEDAMPVFVTTPGGTNPYECGEETVGFIYEPIVTSVEPTSGSSAGGTEVTIKGADFNGAVWGKVPLCKLAIPVVQGVDFGSTPAKSVNIVSESEMTAVAPPGAGAVDVTVKSRAAGHSPIISADQFSYLGAPEAPITEAATSVTSISAVLEGTLEPAAAKLKYDFAYNAGASCEGGSTTPEGEGESKVSTKIEGLTSNTEYTFCLVAKSIEGGATKGKPQIFRTPGSQAEILGRLLAEQAPAREAERQAKAAKEQAEREAAAKRANQPVTATTSSPSATVTGSVSLAATSVTVQGNDMALVKLECLGIASCHGKLTLTVKSTAKAKGSKKARAVMIGTVGFSITGDEIKTVKVELDAAGRALLSTGHGRLSASLALLELAPSPENTRMNTVHLIQRKAHLKTKKGSLT